MKIVRSLFGISLFVSLAAIIFGLTMPLYTDEPAYQNCYQSIAVEAGQEQVAAEQFKLCRETFLSKKIIVIRYSATVFLISIFSLWIAFRGGRSLHAPQKKWIVTTVGLLAAITTGATYVADLLWNASLEVYPHWSDSLGIPIAVAPVLIVFGIIVWGINLLLLRKCTSAPVEPIFSGSWKDHNKFLLAEVFVAVFLVLDACFFGDFFSLIPNLLWLSFFSFAMAWRKSRLL